MTDLLLQHLDCDTHNSKELNICSRASDRDFLGSFSRTENKTEGHFQSIFNVLHNPFSPQAQFHWESSTSNPWSQGYVEEVLLSLGANKNSQPEARDLPGEPPSPLRRVEMPQTIYTENPARPGGVSIHPVPVFTMSHPEVRNKGGGLKVRYSPEPSTRPSAVHHGRLSRSP